MKYSKTVFSFYSYCFFNQGLETTLDARCRKRYEVHIVYRYNNTRDFLYLYESTGLESVTFFDPW